MEHANHGLLLKPHDLAVRHRRRRRDALLLPGQASFAAKFVRSKNCDNSFFALLGKDGDLDLALLNVKNRIRDIPLREDRLILAICGNGSPAVNCGQELFRIKRWGCACQWSLYRLGHAQAAAGAYLSLPSVSIVGSLGGVVRNVHYHSVERFSAGVDAGSAQKPAKIKGSRARIRFYWIGSRSRVSPF